MDHSSRPDAADGTHRTTRVTDVLDFLTPAGTSANPQSITVLYDSECALCRRCRAWLETQRTWVPVHFLAASAEEARQRRPDLPWLGDNLVVVGDSGEVWVGPAAFLICLWATVDYRGWASRLSGPSFAPMAERFFHTVSSNRTRLGAVIGTEVECDDGRCHHRGPMSRRVL